MQITDDDHKNKFVFGAESWRAANNTDTYIWAAQTSYAKTANDPCPSGWHVPSRYEWGALVTGVPATTYKVGDTYNSSTNGSQTNVSIYNTLRYPSAGLGSSAHVGGVVVSNSAGARVFLPAAGYRSYNSGALGGIGRNGYYWSSTYDNNTTNANNLYFSNSLVYAGNNYNGKATGCSVRCVAE
jgi:uncharacterized protein (TIGR02145 family)